MINTTDRLKQLLESGNWSLEDKYWILQYLETTDNNELRSLMEEQFKADKQLSTENPIAKRLLKEVHEQISKSEKNKKTPTPYSVRKSWLVAATALLLVATGALLLFNRYNKDQSVNNSSADIAINDIVPGRDKAKLTLSNGSTIILDSSGNGLLAHEGNAQVTKSGSQVSYSQEVHPLEPVYHIMSTEKGNQYRLQLADGSRVWLNASSSIRFPTAFVGTERKVEITGEVYFEIAHNSLMPFKVVLKDPTGKENEVEVLGTTFNVMAYSDEPASKITLLEGSVRINSRDKITVLKPRQQAQLLEDELKLVSNVDVDEVVAWKNGYFQFNTATLDQLMRQIARWYDVEISYEGKIPVRSFGGKIYRNSSIEDVIKILEASRIRCRTEGRKIIIAQ